MEKEAGYSIAGVGKSLGQMFINLSSEYPAILDAFLFVIAAVGVVVSAWAVFDVIKLGRRDSAASIPGSAIAWRIVGGVGLVDLSFWAKVWSATIWNNANPLGISAYVASGGQDNFRTAMMAVLGFMVIVGYVTLARAYFAIARLGYVSQEARNDLISAVVARLISGSLLISSMHVASALGNSTGFHWMPN